MNKFLLSAYHVARIELESGRAQMLRECSLRRETNLIYRQPQPNPVKHGLVKWGRVLYRLQVRIVSESWRCQRRLPG